MKFGQLFIPAVLLGLFIGCKPDLCEDRVCGPGVCVDGICNCPDGFIGDNCEIELCFGVHCINGDCDPQTEGCNCHPNYYGENCDILCVNGEFANGDCNCLEGYEGSACDIEVRDRFLSAWDCDEWSSSPQIGGSSSPGILPGAIRFKEGFDILEVELFTSSFFSGTMFVNSEHRIVGQVEGNTINFDFQSLNPELLHSTVYGSAILDGDRSLSIELYFFNTTTLLTEEAKGTFVKH